MKRRAAIPKGWPQAKEVNLKRLKKILVSGLAATLIISSPKSNADMFGGDGVPRNARV